MLKVTSQCKQKSAFTICDDPNLLSIGATKSFLEEGKTLMYFSCKTCDSLDNEIKRQIQDIINLSVFENEVEENGVSHVNLYDAEDAKKYTAITSIYATIFPNASTELFTPELNASKDYLESVSCFSSGCKVWNDDEYNRRNLRVARMTQTVIPWIYEPTVQQEASDVEKEDIPEFLSEFDKCLLVERTKSNPLKRDSVAKAKTIFAFKDIEGGVLGFAFSVVLNTVIPGFIARIVDSNAKQQVAKEIHKRVCGCRKYWANRAGSEEEKVYWNELVI